MIAPGTNGPLSPLHQALAGLLVALALPSWLPMPEPPAWVERWLFNAEERTAEGLEALNAGDLDRAESRFDAAARLSPDAPLAQFNAGTGRLLADNAKDAVEPLQRAVDATAIDPETPSLAPPWTTDAYYNLGSAHLANNDPAEAVESFKEVLRRDPSRADAKHNLELALRKLDQQPPSMRPPDPSSESEKENEDGDQDEESSETSSGDSGEQDDDQDPSDSESSESNGDQQPEEGRSEDQGEDDDQGQGRSQAESDNRGENQATSKNRSLENFDQQPDMTAEQAAALLDAVDNLERQQRQAQAQAEARSPTGEDKDW